MAMRELETHSVIQGLCETCRYGKDVDGVTGIDFCEVKRGNVTVAQVKKCSFYSGPRFPVDVAIVTAARVETNAVLSHFHPDGEAAWSAEQNVRDIAWRWTTFGSAEDDRANLRIVMAQTRLKGLPAAAVQATRACHLFQPRWLVMLGITAGLQRKTSIGDVIIPSIVFDYGAGKWSGEEFKPEPHGLDLKEDVYRQVEFLLQPRFTGDLDSIAKEWTDDKPEDHGVRVHLGHAASGAAVVDSRAIWERILSMDKEVIAIDMEAYSVALAGRQVLEVPPHVLIAKSVCDFGVKKNDENQRYAAYTSARFFRLFADLILSTDIRTELPTG